MLLKRASFCSVEDRSSNRKFLGQLHFALIKKHLAKKNSKTTAQPLSSVLSDYPIITAQIRKGLTPRFDRWRTLLKYPMWGFRVSSKVTTCPCFLGQSVLIESPAITVVDAHVGETQDSRK